jgi:hypothetical protein
LFCYPFFLWLFASLGVWWPESPYFAMSSQPEMPQPAHLHHDSMLSRKFGKEVTNYFGSTYGFASLRNPRLIGT